MTDHCLRRDGFFLDLPAIVIGDHRHGSECDLGLARQFRFWQIGHADDVETVAAIEFRFRTSGEGRTVHVHINAPVVNGGAGRPCGFR